jgi:hypothetical protein
MQAPLEEECTPHSAAPHAPQERGSKVVQDREGILRKRCAALKRAASGLQTKGRQAAVARFTLKAV